MENLENFENKYQITKTIRFKLEPDGKIENYFKNNTKEKDLSLLIKQIEELSNKLEKLLHKRKKEDGSIMKNDDGSIAWKCNIKIKYKWLRNYLKTKFYENLKDNQKSKNYKLIDLKYVQEEFDKRWFTETTEILDGLKDFQNKKEHERNRNAQAALILNQFSKRTNFEFIKTFIYSLCKTNCPKTDDFIENLQKDIDALEIELNKQKENFLPSQSKGVQFAAGSFNYYTVNKSPKMLENELKNENEKFNKKIYGEKVFNGQKFVEIDKEYKKHEQIISELKIKEVLKDKSFDETYKFLKKWKAYQKKQFMEAIQAEDDKKAKAIKLFESSEDNFNTIKNRVLKIQELANKLNQDELTTKQKTEYKNELKKIKEEKNEFFNTFTGKPQTENYKSLCEFYKQLAQNRGNIFTKILAIEKDKNIAEQLSYWCVIVEKEKHKYLYMIPRDNNDNLKNAKEYIEKLESDNSSQTKLHYFNSLTLRALRKLCFKQVDNSFKDQFKIELKDKNGNSLKNKNGKIKYKFKFDYPIYEQEWKSEPKKIIKKIIEDHQNILNNKKIDSDKKAPGVLKLLEEAFKSIEDRLKDGETKKFCQNILLEKQKTIDLNSCKNVSDVPKLWAETFKSIDKFWSKKIAKFYQNVLKEQTTKGIEELTISTPEQNSSLDLSSYKGIEEFCNKNFETIEDFESELNKICYTKTVLISNEVENKLKNDYKAVSFKITSQDIEHNLKYGTENYKNKKHTDIWNSFWNDDNKNSNYRVRLNPEVKVMWRLPKESRVVKYGKDSKLYDPKKKNRYLHEQYTLAVTITDNAHNSKINLAFKDTRAKGEDVNNFNKNFGVDKYDYAMGIDVGTADDLACLCVINKEMKPQMFDVYEIKEDKLGFSKIGFLKDGTKREKEDGTDSPYQLIKNPSYFLNDVLYQKTFKESKEDFDKIFAELFEKKQVSALDLTTAKVICGKIILNGDFATHQHLKELNAKRKISQALKINPTVKIYEDNFKWFIEGQKDAVYQSKNIYKYIKPYDKVKQELEEFIKNQQLDDARLEDNINKTRASLVGNMIGVITFLYKQFPGFIALENLEKTITESHREMFEGDITRPLEWALYRKFQAECLVPPISELIKLREANPKKKQNIHQFGIIKFVSESETSLLCPKCDKKAYENSKNEIYIKDKTQGKFKCSNSNCGFDNKTNPGEFASLDTNDKIAAYNIAKRGFKNYTNKNNK